MRGSKKSNDGSFKEVFNEMLESFKIDTRYKEAQILNSWSEIVGKPIAERTNKLFIRDQKLVVELSSAPLKHELNGSKGKIIKLFEEKFGVGIIQEIVFL